MLWLINNHTIEQYFNPGRITDLKRRNLVFSGTSFLIRVRTPILKLALEHINLTWSLKLSWLSRMTPNNFREFMHMISSSSTVTHVSDVSFALGAKNIAWNLSYLFGCNKVTAIGLSSRDVLFFLNAYKYMYSLSYSLYITDLNPDVLIVLATYLLNNNILKCHQTSKMPLRRFRAYNFFVRWHNPLILKQLSFIRTFFSLLQAIREHDQ